MNECDEDEEKSNLPVPEARESALAQTAKQGGEARIASLVENSNEVNILRNKTPETCGSPPLDDARFTAGVVDFYQHVLKEPFPESWLHLLDKMNKQEPK
ncbi:MAG: hypothetical protein WBX25_07975 [Rhodomicrobium sp.]